MSSKEEALSPLLSLGGPFKCGFLFLIRLAWDSHKRIPLLIAIIFMICDIRMQLEIDIDLAVRNLPLQNLDDVVNEEEDETDSEDDLEFMMSGSSSETSTERLVASDVGIEEEFDYFAAGDSIHYTGSRFIPQ